MSLIDILGSFLGEGEYFIHSSASGFRREDDIEDVEIIEDLSPVVESEPIIEDWTEGRPKIINNLNNKNNE